MAITPTAIARLAEGKVLTEKSFRGAGRLSARKYASGQVYFYFRFTAQDGKRRCTSLGRYDQSGELGIDCIQAKSMALELTKEHLRGDLAARLAGESGTSNVAAPPTPLPTEIQETDSTIEAKSDSKTKSLENLLTSYANLLEKQGKHSARSVSGMIKTYLTSKLPEIANKPANTINSADLRQIFTPILEKEHKNSARKLRSILKAAFQRALQAENDPSLPEDLTGFGLSSNPVDKIPTFEGSIGVGDRVLSEYELGLYISWVKNTENHEVRDALLVALYLGGQRMQQVLRVTPSSIELNGFEYPVENGQKENLKTITIFDSKGRRSKPRPHILPLVGEALTIIEKRRENTEQDDPIFKSSKGSMLSSEYTSKRVHEISEELIKLGLTQKPFAFQDIRRTAETLMASMQIPKDIRGQIQSHGLSGVQTRHYDRYSYMPEKITALKTWLKRLDEIQRKHGL